MADEELEAIDLKTLGRFGIGRNSNALYFDGQRVHTDATFRLTERQARFAGAAAIAAILGGLSTLCYSSVYIFDTLFRTKPPVRAEISTPEKAPFPVSIPLQNTSPNAAQGIPGAPKEVTPPVSTPPPVTTTEPTAPPR